MKSNISDKDIRKLRQQLKDLEDKTSTKKSDNLLEEAIRAETQGLGLMSTIKRQREIQEQWQIATEKTTGFLSGFLEGFVGEKAGRALSLKYARASDEEVKKARDFFDQFKKSGDKKEKVSAKKTERVAKDFKSIKKIVFGIQKDIQVIRKAMTGKSSPDVKSSQYYFDERMAGGGRYKDRETNKIVSKDVALKGRTENLSKAIMADEDPMIKLNETVNAIWQSLGPSTKAQKTVHERLDELEDDIEDAGDDSSWLDLLGNGGGGNRRRRGRKNRGRKNRARTRGRGGRGRFGGLGMAGLLGGAAVGYLAYSAVDSFRDPNLEEYNPDFLKDQAIQARESGDTASTQAIQTQISAQKKDIGLQAAGSAAAVGGAVTGAVVTKKLAVKAVKSRAWDLFTKFVAKRAPGLFAKIGARMALAGGLATVPILGWISAAVTVLGSIWLAYDLYQLWKEFSALSDAEKELYDDKKINQLQQQAAPAATMSRSVAVAPGGQVTAAPKAPEEPSMLEKAKINVGAAVSGAVASVKSFFGMGTSGNDLAKYVRVKDSSVDLNGLNPQLKERFAALAKEYNEKTGKKIQVNSGYRSPEEQAALYAKLGPPKAAPPGRSRHESGLAIDINSPDANKAIELGLMSKYGFTRPVRGETWHVEPIETAKRGPTPDNPYKPGAPVAVANSGKVASPETGANPPASVAPTGSSSIVAAQSQSASASSVSGVEPSSSSAASSAPLTAQAATPSMDLTPITSDLGSSVQQQSDLLASNQMAMQAPQAPVVVNNTTQAPSNPAAAPKQDIPKANARPSDSSFMRALARDFAHPTAFTTVSMT